MQGPVSKLPKARFPCKYQLFPYLEKADPGLFYCIKISTISRRLISFVIIL